MRDRDVFVHVPVNADIGVLFDEDWGVKSVTGLREARKAAGRGGTEAQRRITTQHLNHHSRVVRRLFSQHMRINTKRSIRVGAVWASRLS